MAETGISKNCAPSTGTSSGPASSAGSLDAVFGAGVGVGGSAIHLLIVVVVILIVVRVLRGQNV